jgi:hypothetical protein
MSGLDLTATIPAAAFGEIMGSILAMFDFDARPLLRPAILDDRTGPVIATALRRTARSGADRRLQHGPPSPSTRPRRGRWGGGRFRRSGHPSATRAPRTRRDQPDDQGGLWRVRAAAAGWHAGLPAIVVWARHMRALIKDMKWIQKNEVGDRLRPMKRDEKRPEQVPCPKQRPQTSPSCSINDLHRRLASSCRLFLTKSRKVCTRNDYDWAERRAELARPSLCHAAPFALVLDHVGCGVRVNEDAARAARASGMSAGNSPQISRTPSRLRALAISEEGALLGRSVGPSDLDQ